MLKPEVGKFACLAANARVVAGSRAVDQLEPVERLIQALKSITDGQFVFAALREELERLGFDRCTYEVIIPPVTQRQAYYLTTFPRLWSHRYIEQRYETVDIVCHHAVRSTRPFLWSELDRERQPVKLARQLFDEAWEIGLRSGALIPLHGPGPVKAYLSLASDLSDTDFAVLFERSQHVVHLMATYAHGRIIDLWSGEPVPLFRLTSREADVLTWTARGRTRQDIAALLNLSDQTVKDHLERAVLKLGALNKTHAAVIALVNGLIRP